MQKKFLIVLVGILTLSLLGACSATGTQAASTASANGATTPPPSLNVNGAGKVTLIPDIAYINIGVHTEGQDVAEALSSNTAQAQKVADELVKMGVAAKDIQTTNFNVYPQQQYGPNGEQTGIKYMVDNTVYVTVRDLTKLGALLDAVVKSGANNINGISFDVADKTAALEQARKAAVEDAQTQATQIADAAGVKLGKILSINVSSSGQPVPMYDVKGVGGAAASANVPVSAGQLVLEVDVNVSFELVQ